MLGEYERYPGVSNSIKHRRRKTPPDKNMHDIWSLSSQCAPDHQIRLRIPYMVDTVIKKPCQIMVPESVRSFEDIERVKTVHPNAFYFPKG
jgi:hypothetical protein